MKTKIAKVHDRACGEGTENAMYFLKWDYGYDLPHEIKDWRVYRVVELLQRESRNELAGAILLSAYFGLTIEEAALLDLEQARVELENYGTFFVNAQIAFDRIGPRWAASTYKFGHPVYLFDYIQSLAPAGSSTLLPAQWNVQQFRHQSRRMVSEILGRNCIGSLNDFRRHWLVYRIKQLDRILDMEHPLTRGLRRLDAKKYQLVVRVTGFFDKNPDEDAAPRRERKAKGVVRKALLEHGKGLPSGCRLAVYLDSDSEVEGRQSVRMEVVVTASRMIMADHFPTIARFFCDLEEPDFLKEFLPDRIGEKRTKTLRPKPEIIDAMSQVFGRKLKSYLRTRILYLDYI